MKLRVGMALIAGVGCGLLGMRRAALGMRREQELRAWLDSTAEAAAVVAEESAMPLPEVFRKSACTGSPQTVLMAIVEHMVHIAGNSGTCVRYFAEQRHELDDGGRTGTNQSNVCRRGARLAGSALSDGGANRGMVTKGVAPGGRKKTAGWTACGHAGMDSGHWFDAIRTVIREGSAAGRAD